MTEHTPILLIRAALRTARVDRYSRA
jgi:hypothetical protein